MMVKILLTTIFALLNVSSAYSLSLKESQRLIDRGKQYLLGPKENIDSAIFCFRKVADSYRKDLSPSQRELCGKAANNLGYVYLQHGIDCKAAYTALMKAKEICEGVNNSKTLATVYMNTASLFSIFSEHVKSPEFMDEAIRLYKLSIKLACENQRWTIVCSSFCNLTDLDQSFSHVNDYKDVIRTFARLQIPKGTPLYKYSRLRCQSVQAYIDKKPADATAFLIQSINNIDDTISREAWRAQALTLAASLYLKRGMSDSALHYINCILDAPSDYWGNDVKANAYKLLRSIYLAKGEKGKAQAAYSRMLMLRDSLYNVDNLSSIENMKFLYDLATQKHRSAVMLAEANHKKKMREWGLVGSCLLLLLVFAVLLLVVVRNRHLRANYVLLFEKQQDILRKEMEDKLARELEVNKEADAAQMSYTAPQSAVSQKTRILSIMDETEEKFSADFSLDRLAELVGISPRALSAVLNDSLGKTFRDLLNQYRVREACKRLSDEDHYGGLTIEAISQSVGYRSRTSLVTAFKKETGLTPSDFQRIARNKTLTKNAGEKG